MKYGTQILRQQTASQSSQEIILWLECDRCKGRPLWSTQQGPLGTCGDVRSTGTQHREKHGYRTDTLIRVGKALQHSRSGQTKAPRDSARKLTQHRSMLQLSRPAQTSTGTVLQPRDTQKLAQRCPAAKQSRTETQKPMLAQRHRR